MKDKKPGCCYVLCSSCGLTQLHGYSLPACPTCQQEFSDMNDNNNDDDEVMFKPYTRVVADLPKGYENQYPFKNGEIMLFIAEIVDMPGHGVFMTFNKPAKLYAGYHLDNFRAFVDD